MEGFGTDYGTILALIISVITMITMIVGLVYTIIRIIKLTKDGKITREGIVEAFNTVITPQKVLVDLSTKVEQTLDGFKDACIKGINEAQATYQETFILLIEIMSNTAALNKLPIEHQARLKELFGKIKGVETTIKIGG